MSGIFIRGGVCNEACTGRVCHRRVRFLLAAAMSLQNRSVVPGRLPSIFVSHTVISGSGRMRGGRRKPMSSPLPCCCNVAGSAQTHISGLFSLPSPPLAHRQSILVDSPSLNNDESSMRWCCPSLIEWGYRLTWEDTYMAAEVGRTCARLGCMVQTVFTLPKVRMLLHVSLDCAQTYGS